MMKGFTLVELLVAVAVIGILSAIAYPSYRDSVRKAHRTDAKQALLDLGQRMERLYTEGNRFSVASLGSGTGDISAATSPEGYYSLSFSNLEVSAYTAKATRTSKGGQNTDPCGEFTLSHTGQKGVTGGSLNAAECW
jgi:type IV pilus assembly protein PilE